MRELLFCPGASGRRLSRNKTSFRGSIRRYEAMRFSAAPSFSCAVIQSVVQDDLERLFLRRIAECVIGTHDFDQWKVMRNQALRLQLS